MNSDKINAAIDRAKLYCFLRCYEFISWRWAIAPGYIIVKWRDPFYNKNGTSRIKY